MQETESFPVSWKSIAAATCFTMFLCNLHRILFSVLAPTFITQFNISLPAMGVIQSCMLAGYFAGQLPAGVLADRLGGPLVLRYSLLLWSLCVALMPLAATFPAPVVVLAVARAMLGLMQASALPAVSTTAANWFPQQVRAKMVSMVYGSFNLGTVAGLAATPLLVAAVGWAQASLLLSAAGAAAAIALTALMPGGRSPAQVAVSGARVVEAADSSMGSPADSRRAVLLQVLAACWVHGVIGWGFFILQNWIPLYLQHLGVTNAIHLGLLSSMPWLAATVVGIIGGSIGDALVARGLPVPRVRAICHAVATLGPALALLPLALPYACSPALAITSLSSGIALQAFSYAGFHAYVQDVAPSCAGRLLGITNSVGIMAGIVGNLLTGFIAQWTGSYAAVFQLTSMLYFSSFVVWMLMLKGAPIRLEALAKPKASA